MGIFTEESIVYSIAKDHSGNIGLVKSDENIDGVIRYKMFPFIANIKNSNVTISNSTSYYNCQPKLLCSVDDSIINLENCGKFSSSKAILYYNRYILVESYKEQFYKENFIQIGDILNNLNHRHSVLSDISYKTFCKFLTTYYGVNFSNHVLHCCPEHGCNYGSEICPVVSKTFIQSSCCS